MNKLFVLSIICMVLLIGSVSAINWDNSLRYENNDMKVTLENIWGLPLVGSDLGSLELKSHKSIDEIIKVGVGKQIVMYYDFSFEELYEDGLGVVEFMNIKTGELVERNYTYVYFGEEEYEVDVWNEIKLGNGTFMKELFTEILTRNSWLPYNSIDIPKGNITLGIEVDNLPRDYIDAIWKIGGQRISKHASFKVVTVTKTDNKVDTGAGPNYLYSAVNIGTADANRMLVIGSTIGQSGETISSVTVGNAQATEIISQNPDATMHLGLWAIDFPTGITIDIWVNATGSGSRGGMGIWAVYDTNITNVNDTAFATNVGSTTIDVPDGGIIIGYAESTGGHTDILWTGVTEDFDQGIEGATAHSGASDEFATGELGRTVSGIEDGSPTSDDGAVFASWRGNLNLAPTVTLVSPGDETNTTNFTIIFNGTISNVVPDNVTLFINDVGNQTNSTGIIDHYQFEVIVPVGNYTWNYQSCISDGCNNGTARNVNVLKFIENSITFNANALEGSSQLFTINISAVEESLSSVQLIYDGTFTTALITSLDGFSIINDTITVPTVSTDTNKSLFFQLNFASASENTSENNQTVQNFAADNCDVNKNVLYNFTIIDEATKVKLVENESNTTGRVELNVWNIARSKSISNFSTLFNQTNPFTICLNSSLSSGESYVLDLQVQYDADDYAKEFYNFQNESLTSSILNTNISLFDLLDSSNQVFKIIYKSASFLPVENALISIQRKYVDEGIFNISEIPKTDEKGETVGNFVVDNVIYNIIVTKFGEILSTFNNIIAVCQTPLIAQCEIDLNAFSESIEIPDYESIEDFNFTLGYNKTTRIITSIFNIPSGSIDTILLNVTGEDALGTSVCTDTILSSSGTLTCFVLQAFGNSTITAKLYRNGNLQGTGQIKLDQSPSDIYGVTLTGLALFLMLTLIGMSISNNPVYTLISLGVGVVLLFGLNLVASNGFIGATATFLWLAIAIIIVLIKGVRRN